jgi:hypothetical protein
MPFRSKAQERWGFSPSGRKALGGTANVKEWADSTDQDSLPERAGGKMDRKPSTFIAGAISHTGALTRAAKSAGVSKRAEAEKESHSSNPSIRGRGALGLRFMKGGDLHR